MFVSGVGIVVVVLLVVCVGLDYGGNVGCGCE